MPVIPLAGDRAAHDTTTAPALHAKDIEDETFVYHKDPNNPGGASALDELTDVVITSPTNGQVLTYNDGNWINVDSTGTQDLGPDRTDAGGTVTAQGDNSPNEVKEKAFDNNIATKWLDFNNTSWITFQFGGDLAYAISEYTITSANDESGRDPKDWDLYGSNNGSDWTLLDSRSNISWGSRGEKLTFNFSNSTSYKYIKLDITANNGNPYIQIGEIEYFGTVGGTSFDELVQDAVGAMLIDTDTINLTYTDATPELKADAITQMSITSDASGLKLSGDEASPGNNKVYGTNGSGDKGWKNDPAGGGATVLLDSTVDVNGSANFDLQNISGTYYAIKIFLTGKSASNAQNDGLLITFNNDTTNANYRSGRHRGSSVSHSFTGEDTRAIGLLAAATSTRSGAPGQSEITILDPCNTTFEKNAASVCVVRFATEIEVWEDGVEWESTNAISRITLTTNSGSNFIQGTRCVIIGYS